MYTRQLRTDNQVETQVHQQAASQIQLQRISDSKLESDQLTLSSGPATPTAQPSELRPSLKPSTDTSLKERFKHRYPVAVNDKHLKTGEKNTKMKQSIEDLTNIKSNTPLVDKLKPTSEKHESIPQISELKSRGPGPVHSKKQNSSEFQSLCRPLILNQPSLSNCEVNCNHGNHSLQDSANNYMTHNRDGQNILSNSTDNTKCDSNGNRNFYSDNENHFLCSLNQSKTNNQTQEGDQSSGGQFQYQDLQMSHSNSAPIKNNSVMDPFQSIGFTIQLESEETLFFNDNHFEEQCFSNSRSINESDITQDVTNCTKTDLPYDEDNTLVKVKQVASDTKSSRCKTPHHSRQKRVAVQSEDPEFDLRNHNINPLSYPEIKKENISKTETIGQSVTTKNLQQLREGVYDNYASNLQSFPTQYGTGCFNYHPSVNEDTLVQTFQTSLGPFGQLNSSPIFVSEHQRSLHSQLFLNDTGEFEPETTYCSSQLAQSTDVFTHNVRQIAIPQAPQPPSLSSPQSFNNSYTIPVNGNFLTSGFNASMCGSSLNAISTNRNTFCINTIAQVENKCYANKLENRTVKQQSDTIVMTNSCQNEKSEPASSVHLNSFSIPQTHVTHSDSSYENGDINLSAMKTIPTIINKRSILAGQSNEVKVAIGSLQDMQGRPIPTCETSVFSPVIAGTASSTSDHRIKFAAPPTTTTTTYDKITLNENNGTGYNSQFRTHNLNHHFNSIPLIDKNTLKNPSSSMRGQYTNPQPDSRDSSKICPYGDDNNADYKENADSDRNANGEEIHESNDEEEFNENDDENEDIVDEAPQNAGAAAAEGFPFVQPILVRVDEAAAAAEAYGFLQPDTGIMTMKGNIFLQ